MSQQELLRRVIAVLNDVSIQYMATGSIVSSIQGEPRASHDIDLVVQIAAGHASMLAKHFPPPDFYLDEVSIREALKTPDGMFNLLDITGGDKVDFWILKPHPFDQQRFARRYVEKVAGMELVVSQPEDTIVAKLRWVKLSGGSEKQFNDALGVYEVQHPRLDISHIDRWAAEVGVTDLWKRVQSEADLS
jgi:hypothetical protein